MGAPKTLEIPAHTVKPGNIVRLKAGKKLPDYLKVTSVTPVREADGTVETTTEDGVLRPNKVEIKGTGHGAKWEGDDSVFSIVLMGDYAIPVRLKRVRVVYLKNGETLEFVRNANIRMANWLRARDNNGRVRTVFTAEILRKDWEYRHIV